MKNPMMVDNSWITKFNKPFIISGPCSAESQEQVLETALRLDKSYVQAFRAGIWKPRTKPDGFQGAGAVGLPWLREVRKRTSMLMAVEVANTEHVKAAIEHDMDILWIGARSIVNPFSVQEIAEALKDTDKIVLIKNPIYPELNLWVGALERLLAKGIRKVGAIHRGFSTYKSINYRNQPHWQIALAFRKIYPEIPMLCDISHICGNREGLFEVAQQAFNFQYDGLMVETHSSPNQAWSDAKQQIVPERLLEILKKIKLSQGQTSSELSEPLELEKLRTQIDELDEQLLGLLSQRMSLSLEVGQFKKKHKGTALDSRRWGVVLERVRKFARKLGLSQKLTESIFETIHQESVKLQREHMIEEKGKLE